MRLAGVVLLILGLGVPVLTTGQQPLPPNPNPQKLPLIMTDKESIDEWSKLVNDGPPDPAVTGDTQFLLTLNDTEWIGRFRFRQRCALCHAPQGNNAATMGPVLTQRNVVGREDVVRRQIMEGSTHMPAFKYSIEPTTIDAIIAYLKKVDTNRGQ